MNAAFIGEFTPAVILYNPACAQFISIALKEGVESGPFGELSQSEDSPT
jgi:hypothetical protein